MIDTDAERYFADTTTETEVGETFMTAAKLNLF